MLCCYVSCVPLCRRPRDRSSVVPGQPMPTGRKNFEKALQLATKEQLLHTVWGSERRVLLDVDAPYLATMSKRQCLDWQVHTHTHTRTHTHTHAHTHTLTHTQATKQATRCRSRLHDDISVDVLTARPPAFPDQPWRVDRAQVRRDREILLGTLTLTLTGTSG